MIILQVIAGQQEKNLKATTRLSKKFAVFKFFYHRTRKEFYEHDTQKDIKKIKSFFKKTDCNGVNHDCV